MIEMFTEVPPDELFDCPIMVHATETARTRLYHLAKSQQIGLSAYCRQILARHLAEIDDQ